MAGIGSMVRALTGSPPAARGTPVSAARALANSTVDTSRPALVIDGHARGDLGLVRSLGIAGVEVHLLTAARESPAAGSRFVAQTHAFPRAGAPDEDRVARIRAAAMSLSSRPVLLAAGDRALRFLSQHREAFADVLDHDLPDQRVVDYCQDEAQFARIAAQFSLPVPMMWMPRDLSAVRSLAPKLEYPVFVKPLRAVDAADAPAASGRSRRGRQVPSARDLIAACRFFAREGMPRVIVQEYLEGPGHERETVQMYIDPRGQIAGSFTAVESGPEFGDAADDATVRGRRNERLAEMAGEILLKLNHSGFASLRFRRDPRRDEMRLIGIQCRYGSWTELPSRSGCNFPLASYAAATGQPIPALQQHDRALQPLLTRTLFATDDPAPFFWQFFRRSAS